MLKNTVSILKTTFVIGAISFGFAQAALATNVNSDPLHITGTYLCHGYDSHDGAYKNATVTLTLDAKNSDFSHNHGAYHFQLTEPDGIEYVGEAAASGNSLAIYFENTAKADSTDRGVGIATITHDKDENGKPTTEFHKYYYEPTYQGGGNGSETCVKVQK